MERLPLAISGVLLEKAVLIITAFFNTVVMHSSAINLPTNPSLKVGVLWLLAIAVK
jgi:hypothetical protein